MTSTTTTSYTVDRNTIITAALRKLGVLEIGDMPDVATTNNAVMVLNLLIKQMITEGLKLWTIEEGVLIPTASQTSYILGGSSSYTFYNATDATKTAVVDKPLKIIQAFARNVEATPDIDIPLQIVSKQEYNTLGSKFSTGMSNTIFYDVRTTYGLLYVFLTPDASIVSDYEIHFVYQRPLRDALKSGDILDFPNEWMNCLVWNLADQLAIEYSVPQNHRMEITQRSTAYREQLSSWDVEATSTFFQPDMRASVSRRL